MNLIRSDYLKEVAVSAMFFGCMKTEKRADEPKESSKLHVSGSILDNFAGLGVTGEGSDMWHVCHVIRVRLTVGHEIYSCDHRTTERDGTQRLVIILTRKEGEP